MSRESSLALLERARDARIDQVHCGVLVPWANAVVEAELPRLGGDSIVWHYARVVPDGYRTELDECFLQGISASVPSAVAQLSALDLPLVQLACTSAGFVARPRGDWDTDESGVRLTDAFGAILHTLSVLRIRKIILLTPYSRSIGECEPALLRANGVEVIAAVHLGLLDDYRHVDPRQIMAMLDDVSLTSIQEADGVVLSCTGWPTLGLLPRLESELGLPVVSSNLAMAFRGLSV